LKNLILFALTASFALAQPKILGGPLVVNVNPRSATVVWIVDGGEVTLHPPAGATAKISPSLQVEKTTFRGLLANTRYEYDLGARGPKGTFKTPPTRGEPFQFVVYGDNRTRHDMHRRVIQRLLANGVPDFVIQTGDMTEDGSDSALWPIFFDIEKDLLRQAAIFPTLGNHEANTQNFFDFFQVSKPYYSFDWGNAHFSMIDSDLANVSATQSERDAFWTGQTRWLEEDLAASQKAGFRFVVAHHAPFSALKSRQGSSPHMNALLPMLEKYRVSAGFFGHDHNYQRYTKNGIQYVITGGGGAPLYTVDDPDPAAKLVKAVSIENFVTVSVNGNVARIEAIAVDGSKLDQFEIQAGQPILPSAR
jgi:hypothetical protein